MVYVRRPNPFKIGDRVVFEPDERAIGWTWSSFERLRIYPGYEGVVTRSQNDCLLLDDGRGGFDWECFKFAAVSRCEAGHTVLEKDFDTPKRLSAKATRKDGQQLTEAEIEAAEAEAEAWARRVNSC